MGVIVFVRRRARPHNQAAVLEALQHFGRARVGEVPGLVQCDIGLDADEPTRLIILHGWDSPGWLEQFHAGRLAAFSAYLNGLGLSVTCFQGLIRAQFTR